MSKWTNPSVVTGMKVVTWEALVNLKEAPNYNSGILCQYEAGTSGKETWFLRFEGSRLDVDGSDNNEGTFRVSAKDSNEPPSSSFVNKWTHFAVVYNTISKHVKLYIDGILYRDEVINNIRETINLGYDHFLIGSEYFPDREGRHLRGKISEVRIWNKERTKEEIANHFYEVDPHSEGLVSYWKFDEWSGETIHDRTENSNDAAANITPLNWFPISLPEKK